MRFFISSICKQLFLAMLLLVSAYGAHAKIVDVTTFGAVGDFKTLDTKAIQKAIDQCASEGGGTVFFPSGNYLSGTIFLKDNIHLYFERGASLIATTDVIQFPLLVSKVVSLRPKGYALIYAEGKHNITISGYGRITGQGDKPPYRILHKDQDADIVRPRVLCFISCSGIQVKDIRLENSAFWMQNYLHCEDVLIENITVSNRYSSVNNDGIDIDGCKNVRIANCNINSEDDCIVLKSTSDKLCENVVITNCVLSSHCNALKLGTESNGGFRNIAISNCTIYDTYLSGIALEIVDGGIMDLVNINNITMNATNNPIFIKLGNRARPYSPDIPVKGIGTMTNIQLSNIQANNVGGFIETPDISFSHHNAEPKASAIFISGIPEKAIDNISLENISINYEGGGTLEDAVAEVPENPTAYPEYSKYGKVRPAYGFFGRHISGLTLRNISVSFDKPDFRPAFIFDRVSKSMFYNLRGEKSDKNKQPIIKINNCSELYVETDPLFTKRNNININQSTNVKIK